MDNPVSGAGAGAAPAAGARHSSRERLNTATTAVDKEIIIVGAGLYGIVAAIAFPNAGFDDLLLVEQPARHRA
ncbi:hypothetical protein, partial [Nocardia cyriacigeorgica]|uniref:hypothetical protein n=1 Tax=Nocardia cyriacigeorgica TaxID=135487 RepID=UPI002457B167